MPQILDGRIVSEKIAAKLRWKISRLNKKPGLAIIQVGDLAASNLYVKRKNAFAEKIGATVFHLKFPQTVSKNKLLAKIEKLNRDKTVHGIIVQLPLPAKLDKTEIIDAIALAKDVDGLQSGNHFTPATARGVLTLLDYYKIKIAGRRVVVVGRSTLVGRPIALALLGRGATVTVCHRQTKNLARETKLADILVVAAGQLGLITKKHVRRGQVIIDVGTSLTKNNKLVGDVYYSAVVPVVRAISPVPGGVGPMTVAALFLNLFDAYNMLK